MVKADIKLQFLASRLEELRKEQSEYERAIRSLSSNWEADDSDDESIAIKSLRVCKKIADEKIKQLENIDCQITYTEGCSTFDGVIGIRKIENDEDDMPEPAPWDETEPLPKKTSSFVHRKKSQFADESETSDKKDGGFY